MSEQKYDTEKLVILIGKHHGNVSAVAKAMKCSRQTIHTYAKDNEAISQALQDAREEITDIAESKLLTAIKSGEAWAVCFYLKTQGRGRGYVEKQINVNVDMSKLSDDELRAIAED